MLLDPSTVKPVPWRNGAGSTRELAVGEDQAGQVQWRISLADLDGPAEFSIFNGMDRIFVPLGGVRLTIDEDTVHLQPGQHVQFPGEAAVSVEPDGPTQALNVMVRRAGDADE
jgi:environmental stress-induced protein Ves